MRGAQRFLTLELVEDLFESELVPKDAGPPPVPAIDLDDLGLHSVKPCFFEKNKWCSGT